MAQRSRKRSRRQPPPRGGGAQRAPGTAEPGREGAPVSRSEQRNIAVRARLAPLAPGERPWPVTVCAVIAALIGIGNLIAFLAGAKIGGKRPAAGGIVLFALLMVACAVGLWRLRYWAVLGFMALLAIVATLFALLLTEASNLLGFLVPPVIIAGAGFLFWKLVRVLSRIQMPQYPGR